ncbi:hypothetical protein [Sphingomonas dokdonensis]|uniref:Uncharacterized protein n=1 Tax=Sphingomonas dokdonensis TaxID=344880 RepID=A0A245ZTS6_9SPHN|nr:hypothetical protein [Sphingomonas dokdonensis]OWK33149.1 hypothetical protein SPDO_00230 [Sphingomonas dokdonensis]
MITRRSALTAAAATPVALLARAAPPDIAADLNRYIDFGSKASGGAGDIASGEWIADELRQVGFAVSRLHFDAPFFEPRTATLAQGGRTSQVIPQAVVVPTGPQGVTGTLVRVDPRITQTVPRGAVALVDLPHQRWSTATAPAVRETVAKVAGDGAVAAILITNGPTGKAVALNAPADKPLFPIPTACLAPDDAPYFLAAVDRPATLTLDGESGRRPAFNVLGRLDRGAARTIVVSTPRSGWFTCGGERAPGIAVWLDLMRWAPGALKGVNLFFTCNSGHEYENAGSEALVERVAPRPDAVPLWLHLGAAVAARDWQEFGGTLRPLPSADPQRLCVATAAMTRKAKAAFAGLPGLESPLKIEGAGIGETGTIIAAGYTRTVGLLGAHRFHHTREDLKQTVDAALTWQVAAACRTLLTQAI